MRKIFAILALAMVMAAPARADNYETVPSISGVYDTTTGVLYGITPTGVTNVTLLPVFNANGGVAIGTTATPPANGIVAGSITLGSTTLATTNVSLTNGAASATGTLTNAPTAGNATKWIPINDNGTTRYIPAW